MWFQQEKLCQKHIILRYEDKERFDICVWKSRNRISKKQIGRCARPKWEKWKLNHLGMAVRFQGELGGPGYELAQGGTGRTPLL